MPWCDAGVNLTHARLHEQLPAILARAQAAGVGQIVAIGTDVATSQAAQAIAAASEASGITIVSTAGVHPHDAAAVGADYLSQLRQLATQPQVRAMGECGLDFNRNFSPPDQQLRVFRDQLELAIELQLPVYLHERDAFSEQYALLQHYASQLPRLLVHCFTGDCRQLEKYLELGCYIGVTGWVCDERRGDALRQAVPMIPDERLLIETDAPFLLPRTITKAENNGVKPSFNEPAFVAHIAAQVAHLRQQDVNTIQTLSWRNSAEFFSRKLA